MLQTILDALNAILANEYFVAISLGLVISLAGTQWLKYRLPAPSGCEKRFRWLVRLVSLPLGFVPTFLLWPGPWQQRSMWALAVAFSAPAAYRVATAALYKRWPELEQRLNANPWKDDGEDSGA